MKVSAAIICDDARRENNGKEILIGVYSGDIVVPALPFAITIAVWLELVPEELGQHEMAVRLSYAGDVLFEMTAGLNIKSMSSASFATPGFQFQSDKLGELVVEVSKDNRVTWQEVKRKQVIQGHVESVLPPPRLSS